MPYRPLFAENRLERGWCPWCRAEIELDRSTVSSVCPACNARYAPAFATTPPRAPVVALAPNPRVMRVLGVIDALIRIPAIVFIGGFALMAVGLVTAVCVIGGVTPNRRTRAWLTSAFPELRSGHR